MSPFIVGSKSQKQTKLLLDFLARRMAKLVANLWLEVQYQSTHGVCPVAGPLPKPPLIDDLIALKMHRGLRSNLGARVTGLQPPSLLSTRLGYWP
jgi:hypothetical protein